jgi:plastocyanin
MKIKPSLLVCCAALIGAGPLLADTVVEGHVVLPKSPSPVVVNKRYAIVSTAGVLSPFPPVAIVYLEGSFPKPANLRVKQMAQKDLAFIPAILAVQAGTRVEFPNFDDTYHNIFSYSPAKRFDLGRYMKDETPVPSEVFPTPGLVVLRCDIHEHMRGLILVLDTPYFVTTGPDGNYRLSGLPSGTYSIKAWTDSQTTLVRKVNLGPDSTTHLDFP